MGIAENLAITSAHVRYLFEFEEIATSPDNTLMSFRRYLPFLVFNYSCTKVLKVRRYRLVFE